jgi:dihydrofolate synthase/folylpolyglutamate synthase
MDPSAHPPPASHAALFPVRDDADFERFLACFTSYERLRKFDYNVRTMRLSRMRSFLAEIGDPHLHGRNVHVAGTKGKGSTCLMLEALLLAEGYRVGTYLSPHIEHVRERIRIDGAPIEEPRLAATVTSLLGALERRRGDGADGFPTFFELMTALAMYEFRSLAVDYSIYEVGLGGRLDATNVIDSSWTAITGIGLEHTQVLGDTLRRIAAEKAGILKRGIPLVLGPMAPESREPIVERARALDAPLEEVERDAVTLLGSDRMRVRPFARPFPCGCIRGPGLRADLAIATRLWHAVLARAGRAPDEAVLARALERLILPARLEQFPTDPPVLLDGAHTTDSIASLCVALEELVFPAPRVFVFSIASDKNVRAILREVAGVAHEFIFTRCDPVRSVAPADLARELRALAAGPGGPTCRVVEDPREAFWAAQQTRHPIVVTGSLYLTGTIRPLLRQA